MADHESVIPPSARGLNFWDADPNLQFELRHRIEPIDRKRTERLAQEMGHVAGGELDRLAALADRNPPVLCSYDAVGNRVDHVEYHPAYRDMEVIAFERFALAAMSHRPGVPGWPATVPHAVKYLLSYIFGQSEFGLLCPVSMTDSVARIVKKFASDEIKARYLPRLTSSTCRDLWQGAMFITEKQAGSDVGGIRTIARNHGGHWTLHGEKWFCSNVDAGVILTLARPEGAATGTKGLGLFLVPRHLPNGERNRIEIHRLKDKLGSRSMASGEVRFDGTIAYPIGEVDQGLRQTMEMINVSRLSNAMRAAAIMRRACLEALLQARGREAFGARLVNLPLGRSNLVDLLIETEAATAFVLFSAQVLDRADSGDEAAGALIRILTPLAKYAVCRRARRVAGDAMDVRGGNGFIEDWVNPRLVRDAHLGSIWEGTSNVVALDVVRALRNGRSGEILAGAVEAILSACRHEALGDLSGQLAAMSLTLFERAEAVAASDRREREPRARALADAIYDLVSTALLAEEAQWQLESENSARKLLAARLFLRRHLAVNDPLAVDVPILDDAQFEALVDWKQLPESAAAV